MTDNHSRFAKIQCALFKGNDRDIFIDEKEFEGPIYEQLSDAFQFILKHINIGAEVNGLYSKDVYELPIKSIRELVANASYSSKLFSPNLRYRFPFSMIELK